MLKNNNSIVGDHTAIFMGTILLIPIATDRSFKK